MSQILALGVLVSNPSPLLEGGTNRLWLVPRLETVPDGLTDWLTWTLIPPSGTGRAVENAAPAKIGNALPAIRHRDQGGVDRCKWCHGCSIIRLHWSSHVQEL